MEHDFRSTFLGVITGGLLLAIAVYTALNWTADRVKTAAVDLPAPAWFVPK